jgi:hypothetical protein
MKNPLNFVFSTILTTYSFISSLNATPPNEGKSEETPNVISPTGVFIRYTEVQGSSTNKIEKVVKLPLLNFLTPEVLQKLLFTTPSLEEFLKSQNTSPSITSMENPTPASTSPFFPTTHSSKTLFAFPTLTFEKTKNFLYELLQFASMDPIPLQDLDKVTIPVGKLQVLSSAAQGLSAKVIIPQLHKGVAALYLPSAEKEAILKGEKKINFVVLSCGSKGIRLTEEDLAHRYNAQGLGVLLLDHARSKGVTSTMEDQIKFSMTTNAVNVLKAVSLLGRIAANVVLQGESLGSMAIYQALQLEFWEKFVMPDNMPRITEAHLYDTPPLITFSNYLDKNIPHFKVPLHFYAGNQDDFADPALVKLIQEGSPHDKITIHLTATHHDAKAMSEDYGGAVKAISVDKATQYNKLALIIHKPLNEISQYLGDLLRLYNHTQWPDQLQKYMSDPLFVMLKGDTVNTQALKDLLSSQSPSQEMTLSDFLEMLKKNAIHNAPRPINFLKVGEILKDLPLGGTFGPHPLREQLVADTINAVTSSFKEPQA